MKAVVKLPNIEELVEIKRSFKQPKKLIINDKYRDIINPILELASRGQHVLTRREILNYITADAGTRGQQIQKLLKLTIIDDHRRKINKVRNKLKNDFKTAEENLNNAEAAINSTIGEELDDKNVLDFINKHRAILGGQPLPNLDSSHLKDDIHPPMILAEDTVNMKLLEQDIHNIQRLISQEDIQSKDSELRDLKLEITSNTILKSSIKRLRLTRLGMDLLEDDGKCPLCDTPWDLTELKEHLKDRLKLYEEAASDLERMHELSKDMLKNFNQLQSSVMEIIKALEKWGENYHEFRIWCSDIQVLSESLGDLDKYPEQRFSKEEVARLLAPENIFNLLDKVYRLAEERSPEPSVEQTSWDLLTRLEVNVKTWEDAKKEYESAYHAYCRGEILLKAFLKARNKVLNQLYGEIKDRFVQLYQELHGRDEASFDANIISEGAGIDFQVDFLGRGVHPAHSLHSEGHQDSMGICLYLALAERLTQGYIDLIVLDDVMMSVDAPHRREICRLLAGFFKGRQFFITTHDQTWARQLRMEGVVSRQQVVELYNWSLDSGPDVNIGADMWDRINEDLLKNDVPAAAAKLRRGSEGFFRSVCDSLQAPVKFKENGQYELGELLPPALSTYKKWLKEAKIAAESWKNEQEFLKLKAIDDNSKIVFGHSNTEQWAVNPNVHYNNWANFTTEDFKPVVGAFEDLFNIFLCDECEGMLHLSLRDGKPETVRCNCGRVNWNLNKKS